MRDELEEFDTFDTQLGCGKNKTQLDLYLEEPNLDRKVNSDLDVLAYWKENKRRYSELSLMARDVLRIPITTVASESTFSIGGSNEYDDEIAVDVQSYFDRMQQACN
ncbi:hypothetical protein KY290_003625 [Solanum tuberosum]|uniref:HAT C-terminal dimerisation domain-containing protein n=1 Tax=Solanum tuberosum TaxID=4113 RepID=A0ABQ7WTE6_SOLTU|nr:hypothetical protein KY284_003797 [Solanum tuberosum]KAH0732684.1 hypothetical protein KY289_003872 [Solanum tuberosum]KAH0784027.1 hypothetical protein KY290_003625 [Solanum tuberosum]